MGKLSSEQVQQAQLTDWRVVDGHLQARFNTGDFRTGADLVARIADAADAANHHPDITLTYPSLEVRLISHDVGALTERDVNLAREISLLAAQRQVTTA